MTRANLIIKFHKEKYYFHRSSDGYPEAVIPELWKYVKATPHVYDLNVSSFSEDTLFSNFSHVGNWDYQYEWDVAKNELRAWHSKMRWINAPDDWEKKGWHCYQGKNGKYGFHDFVKGEQVNVAEYIFQAEL